MLSMSNIILTEQVSTSTISEFAEFTNKYGFMVIFSVVVLAILIILFINHEKISIKKQEAELDSINKERSANLEQNKKMFDLVTNVQTEQIVQLREMTISLHDLNKTMEQQNTQLDITKQSLDDLQSSIEGHNAQAGEMLRTLNDINTIAKTNEATNKEVLNKISELELRFLSLYPRNNDDDK